MPPKVRYNIGDVLMARDGGKSYVCKVVNIDKDARIPKYFVHYNGWNRRWDKWVDESCLSKREAKTAAKASKKVSADTSAVPTSEGGEPSDMQQPEQISERELDKANKKRKRELILDNLQEEEDGDSQAVKIQIPFHLQKLLVHEWDVITHEPRHLISLPRQFTVANLLAEFLSQKMPKVEADQFKNYEDLVKELVLFFDQALPVLLLYRQEISQFETEVGDTAPSQVYGAEHLLRLFVRLPRLLMQTAITSSDYNQILNRLAEIVKFIQKNSEKLIGKGQYIPVAGRKDLISDVEPSTPVPEQES